ncbi:MAG: exodeoxyribonuclease V subunit alpha [Deltaproteobacteria bacterium]|nr:exodeoxyribonuclease V subunit alpha [Deltaproteobacteria bacterium]
MTEGLSPLSTRFADFICRLERSDSPDLFEAAAAASQAVENGHVFALVAPEGCAGKVDRLRTFGVIGAPGDFAPLVLDDSGRLYLYRYWKYLNDLMAALHARNAQKAPHVDRSLLEQGMARLFPAEDGDGEEGLRAAAEGVVNRTLSVITGGPGTGKTWTVVKILALLIEQAAARGVALRPALAAPTGKAVARLGEAVAAAQKDLDCDPTILSQIPDHGFTLHRLLGARTGSQSYRHHAGNLLPYHVVVVDEASMIDLALMSRLVEALPPDSRLILLGDKDQLASVEPGHVFGDLCNKASIEGVVELRKNYRYPSDSGIARLADAVRSREVDRATRLLRGNEHSDVSWLEVPRAEDLEKSLYEPVVAGYSAYLESRTPAEALDRFHRFRILCALRRGPYGVRHVNALCQSILTSSRLVRPGRNQPFKGQPVLVTRNDYGVGLFNGDTGILWPDPADPGLLRAYFPTSDGTLKALAPGRLPPHELSWAITVHKSQGSEFDRVLVVLPAGETPLVGRELLYTAVTRAGRQVTLAGHASNLQTALQRRDERDTAEQLELQMNEPSAGD